jgi:hypothetical protein
MTAKSITKRLTRLVPDRTVPTGADELSVLTWVSSAVIRKVLARE